MREIVLDTETTGLDPGDGHRIVEIGCIELVNHMPTGRSFQAYLNPDRAKRGCPARKSSDSPCTSKASDGIARSGLR